MLAVICVSCDVGKLIVLKNFMLFCVGGQSMLLP